MTHTPTGPRPQRHELDEAIDAFIDGLAGVVPAAGLVRGTVKEQALRLLERLNVDTASVRVTADHAPHLTVPAPHDPEA